MTIVHDFDAAASHAPRLETERLILRGHRRQDFQAYVALWADPQVVRWIGGRPFSAEETWSRLLRGVGHWRVMGFGYWIIEEKSSGRLVGEAGLGDFRREITPSFGGAPEAGWALAPRAHGQGYATEAVQAVLAWSDRELKPQRVVCIIAPENAASIRVAAKCGFQEVSRTSYRGEPTLVFER